MDKELSKRLKRNLLHKGILFGVIIAVLCFVFGFSPTGWEIRSILYFFGLMALATLVVWFYRYLESKNMSIFEYLDLKLGPRAAYIYYILGAVLVGVIISTLLKNYL